MEVCPVARGCGADVTIITQPQFLRKRFPRQFLQAISSKAISLLQVSPSSCILRTTPYQEEGDSLLPGEGFQRSYLVGISRVAAALA